jgi:predicted nucleic acid-binding protein
LIVYVDSSVLARAYLSDESGHDEVVAMIENPELGLVTGTWSRIEVSGALVRAARAGRGDEKGLLSLLDADLASDGPVTVIAADRGEVERRALHLVREHAIRAMDAWHLATAELVLPTLAEAGEETGFATRDQGQSAVASVLGLRAL